jgi:hypothetical protein
MHLRCILVRAAPLAIPFAISCLTHTS